MDAPSALCMRPGARMSRPHHLTFTPFGFDVSEVAFLLWVLNDARSWASLGFSFGIAPPGSTPQFDMHLTEGAAMAQLFPAAFTGMSVTDRRGKRPVVHLNAENWATPPAASGYPATAGGQTQYRIYVVNHEVGHVLGLEHATCPGHGPAPVMMQQTRGCGACVPDPWVQKRG